jgi:hypothetical protein
MSDRTFRLILDGKKGQLVKGSTPASAAKKVGFYTNSVKTGKSSIIFELQETTKDSKKKVYGPYKIKVKMAGGVNPFSPLSTNIKPNTKSLPPFVVNNSSDLPNHVNLSYNFSGVRKNDLVKQLSTLIKIKERIQKLHDEFSKALINKKKSEKTNNITLPKLRTNKLNKSDINFANYNLQESLARGDIEQKFYELSNFYEKINNLIYHIQETLSK